MVALAFARPLGAAAPPGPTDTAAAGEQARAGSAIAGALDDSFGSPLAFDRLGELQPDLAQAILAAWRRAQADGQSEAVFRHAVLGLVRARMVRAALVGDGAELDDVQRIRLGLLRRARAAGGDTCTAYLRTGELPLGIDPPDALRAREQALARRMLGAGLLGPLRGLDARRATIPGEIVSAVTAGTGLSQQTVRAAFQDQGSADDRCSVTIGLLEATLTWNGPERRDILLTL